MAVISMSQKNIASRKYNEKDESEEFKELLGLLNSMPPDTSESEGVKELMDFLYNAPIEEPEQEEYLVSEVDDPEEDQEFLDLLNPEEKDQEYLVSEEDDPEEYQKLLDFLNDIGTEVEESEGAKQILDFLGIEEEEEANTKLYKSSPQRTGYKPDTSNPPKINNEIQSGLYNVWASGEDARSFEEQKRGLELLKQTTNSIGRLHGSKIERMKESGLNEEESQGLSIWISLKYPLINAALRGASGDKEDLEIGTAAAISSAKALRKLPGFTFEEMRKNAPEGYTDEDFREDGTLIRGVSIDSENIDSFLEIYKSSLKSGKSFHEPYMFASTGRKEHSIVEDSNIRYIVNPISDGSGQGKAIDQFKNENYEDEVLYPPYSKFKVKEIKDYRNIPTSIRDVELFPYWDSDTSKKIPPFILQTLKKIDRSGEIKREEIDVLTEFMNFCYDRKISGQSPEEYLKEADPELVKKYSGYDVLSLGLSDIVQLDTFLSSVHEINRQSRQDGDVVIYLDEV
jgi:hypothetical protein